MLTNETALQILKDAIKRDLQVDEIPSTIDMDIECFIGAIYDIYGDMFEVEDYTNFYNVKAKKTSYIDWIEYKALLRHINLYMKPKTDRVVIPNKMRWKSALLNLFCQHTKCLRKKWRDHQEKLRIERKEYNRKLQEEEEKRRLHRWKMNNDPEYRAKIEKEEEERRIEHERRMKEDPEYRLKMMNIFATNYNVLQIMSGCARMAYTT